MKLYTKPGACSTADHIALRWTGCPFEVEVMTAESLKAPGYLALNPAGTVPVLVDGDFVLTQNAAIVGYIADRFPDGHLAGDGGAHERAEATRWLSFVNADLHPAFTPLFAPGKFIADEAQYAPLGDAARVRIRGLMESADRRLADREWLAGFRSFADPYFYMTVRWAHRLGVDMRGLEHVAAFKARMEADPDVQKVLRDEGLA